jgi:hypothetical protein
MIQYRSGLPGAAWSFLVPARRAAAAGGSAAVVTDLS